MNGKKLKGVYDNSIIQSNEVCLVFRMLTSSRSDHESCTASSEIELPLVSIIMPVYNSSRYLGETLDSVLAQTYRPLEVVMYDDCSSDDSRELIEHWMISRSKISNCGLQKNIFKEVVSGDNICVADCWLGDDFKAIFACGSSNHGPGFARNSAISLSSGTLLCHLDSDDMMVASRVQRQALHWKACGSPSNIMIGCNFERFPVDSTPFYTNWANSLTDSDLYNQRFRECTIICPSWMYTREQFNRIAVLVKTTQRHKPCEGIDIPMVPSHDEDSQQVAANSFARIRGFVESSEYTLDICGLKRVPEDLFFFLDHISLNGTLTKIPEKLITYRYAEGSWALGTCIQDLARVRIGYIQKWIELNSSRSVVVQSLSKRRRKALQFESRLLNESNFAELSSSTLNISENKLRKSDAEQISLVIENTEDSKLDSECQNYDSLSSISKQKNASIVGRDWSEFSIWGYGRDGKKFVSMLQPETAARVKCFIDVDAKKINGSRYYCEQAKKHIPIIHFSDAQPPFVVCVASKRAGDELETNIKSVGPDLVEGVDYIHFN